MAQTYNKVNSFVQNLLKGQYNLNTDALYVFMTNGTPTSGITAYGGTGGTPAEIAAGNGYSAGGFQLTVTSFSTTPVVGVATLSCTNTQTGITATGSIPTFSHAILYDNTNSSKYDIGYWDCEAPVPMGNTDQYNVFVPTILTIATNALSAASFSNGSGNITSITGTAVTFASSQSSSLGGSYITITGDTTNGIYLLSSVSGTSGTLSTAYLGSTVSNYAWKYSTQGSFIPFYQMASDIGLKVHDFTSGSTGAIYLFLTNTAPAVTATTYTSISGTDLATGHGYTAGGIQLSTTSVTSSDGTASIACNNAQNVANNSSTWAASGGTIGPFRYLVMYNNTASGKNLIGLYDYGKSITLNDTQTFTFSAQTNLLQFS